MKCSVAAKPRTRFDSLGREQKEKVNSTYGNFYNKENVFRDILKYRSSILLKLVQSKTQYYF